MSEGILLPPLGRGALPSAAERIARVDAALPQIRAVLEGEADPIAIQATLACLLFQTLAWASFCGFYRRVDARTLAVGPYQGPMGCLRIDLSRGVCGACARTGEIQLVADVSRVADHIACDDGARSELVLPVHAHAEVRAVLDLDSHHLDAFSRGEADRLASLLADVFRAAAW